MKAKGGLGRGLAALLPAGDSQLRDVDVDLIVPNPRQPRQRLDPESIAELAESIRQHGVLQPLIVTAAPTDGGARPTTYQLIAGERRWQAAKAAGLERVPVIVKEASPQALLELALVENIQRRDLGPLEEAMAFRQLIDEFGLTQDAVAERVGRHRSSVANTLRLLRLPAAVKALVADGQLSEGHARALLALPTDDQMVTVAQRAVAEGWTVRQLERAVKTASAPKPARALTAPSAEDIAWRSLQDRLRQTLSARVELTRGRTGGKIVIHFASDDELNGIIDRLGLPDG
ncbi:MAG: ParB/RepB/Spo0J family partition protein [Dehalococcoidia bacterium]|nr:ParB/RepB/Spo0J family partition protein [Dehalococcoidia bacterium]